MKNILNPLKSEIKKQDKKTIIIVFVLFILLIAAFVIKVNKAQDSKLPDKSERTIKYWTCSMHPQIKLPKKGLCPICAMDLIPVHEDGDSSEKSKVTLTLNDTARELAEVETTEVKYESVTNEVRLVGKVAYDETKLSYISAWVPGRIDRLYVDFTGTHVRKGDHLIELYSPELISAQQEYIQSIKNWEDTKDSELGVMKGTAESTLKSAKEKLRLLGLTAEQIEKIAEKQTTHITITSPVSGTVIEKNGFEGMYVQTGDKIYTIADLKQVWLYLNAYESDIQWLHYGQHVSIEAEAYPGEFFHGKIAFIDPFVNEQTRTIRLRVNVTNIDNKLKPGMFVRAAIKAELGEGGRIYEEDLAGRWICPMHPDVIKDHEGKCDICGMDLISTKEFGFAEAPLTKNRALVIPKSAPLITGQRAVVYVENTSAQEGMNLYEGREVVLGPRAGDKYVVRSGLRAGERVVTKGNFKIDSALQIHAKPSMMNPAGYYSETDNIITKDAAPVLDNAGVLAVAIPFYLHASYALAQDNVEEAVKNLTSFKDKLIEIIEINNLTDKKSGIAVEIKNIIEELTNIDTQISAVRGKFGRVSLLLRDILNKYEYKEDLTLYLIFCPMAFENKGAYWLQEVPEVKNPYFGPKMLRCGEVKGQYGRQIKEQEQKPITGHEGH